MSLFIAVQKLNGWRFCFVFCCLKACIELHLTISCVHHTTPALFCTRSLVVLSKNDIILFSLQKFPETFHFENLLKHCTGHKPELSGKCELINSVLHVKQMVNGKQKRLFYWELRSPLLRPTLLGSYPILLTVAYDGVLLCGSERAVLLAGVVIATRLLSRDGGMIPWSPRIRATPQVLDHGRWETGSHQRASGTKSP